MKLWLVCFLILFFGAETAQWLGQLPWISGVELSLPLTVVGGVGLAIASNYGALYGALLGRNWPTFGTLAAKPGTSPLPGTTPPPSPPAEKPVNVPKTSRKADTISFEIKKPQAKG